MGCRGPGERHTGPVVADGLCQGHFQQRRRTGRLKPLGLRADRVRISGIRVTRTTYAILQRTAEAQESKVASVAGDALENWAEGQAPAKRRRRADS